MSIQSLSVHDVTKIIVSPINTLTIEGKPEPVVYREVKISYPGGCVIVTVFAGDNSEQIMLSQVV